MSHRDTQKYVDSEILSEFGCEHGSLLTSYRPYDYTDEEVEEVLKWWRDRPELITEEKWTSCSSIGMI